MAVFDEDIGAGLALADSGAVASSPPLPAPAFEPVDWKSLYEHAHARAERERARADAAEARCEELRWAEVASRARSGSLKWQLDKSRTKLKAAVEETKEIRRAARSALSLQAEVARLRTLVSESAEGRTIALLREENARLKQQLRSAAPKGFERRLKLLDDEVADLRVSLRRSHEHKERIEARHRDEIDWLNKDIAWLRGALVRSADRHRDENASLRRQLDRRRAAAGRMVEARERTIRWLRERVDRLLAATVRATDLIASLRENNARLRAEVRDLKDERAVLASRAEKLEAELEKLRATRSVLSKALFGSKSERQSKPRSGRKRGQQPGAVGHGRMQRPELGERTEKRNPPKDARACSCCGKPYVANGERVTTVIEIEVKAHKRRIVRPRWRRSCDCASSPREVTAAPEPRLFDTTPYGISVWICILFERFVCCRPLHRVAAWLADMGLTVSPGTLADSVKRLVPLFEPLAKAILAHQNKTTLRHADETTWRVQALREKGRSSRAWLWTSVSGDAVYFQIDPSRSAEVAMKLFGSVEGIVVLVCDRLSTYKRLARELGGKIILQWCWAHQRRSFIDCAAGHVRLTRWCQVWIGRIAEIYRLNGARLEHYDPGLEHQTPAFHKAQGALRQAVDSLFADAEAELAGLSAKALRAKPLRSLVNHRAGLSVFVDRPQVPPDNNRAELALRGAVIGRRLSFGSDSETGAEFTAVMYSVAGTLAMNGIDVRRWLEAWLTACAKNGSKPPDDLSPWLPWSMSEGRRRAFTAPR